MNKRDYFIAAINADAWRHRIWIFSVFTLSALDRQPLPEDRWPYRVYPLGQGLGFVSPDNPNELIPIEDATLTEPLFGFAEQFTINPGELPNVKIGRAHV